ncbi:TPA: endolytic transglycosylase MltG [Stenotrophomonas maltophilia]|uniref:endolytic transglycosylase MltG n=1 Tax=Stenotrophomonas TaxID=40323 RepID=UPI000C15A056|nr:MULTISPECIES: endolytic transglycosylase MltG [Stenotrophomonas]MBA0233852.1 endolytic transglycosylase MltG [Stenotrophomonas maltophilia]MBA0267792.1 endolytic transglycosylase MltG [Stenotrophomonas maltophilia]MBA0331985.1 endolytic transglycosylase MltG [Stenotrophomonas maltophilia]MBN5121139.1 endolytic transglycosylase MltG [Stenotrophomonas maltophilia]MCU1009362.1 endolytic transglycosylase MltG [Stenotrophomonas maltophilia]
MAGAKRGCLFVVTLVVVLGAVVAGVGAWFFYQQTRFAAAPITPTAESMVIASGDGMNSVLRKLRDAGVDEGQDTQWQLLARQLDAAGKLKVGEYALNGELTPRELLLRMRAGKVLQHRVTIVEGWNIRQLRAALKRAEPLLHTTDNLDDAALMQRLGFGGQHPEGRFLPETYVYQRGDSDLDVLKRAHAAMEKALDEAWESRAPDLPINTPYELLTMASIIEKETALASERPQIAGVFMRRLKIGMRLQTDPTVIYGLGAAYDGNIRRRDLTTDTPYNTYTRAGLTPTPIAMPSRDALMAAAQPAAGDALYFVAVGDGSGAHVFSPSLDQHNAAVARYLQQLRQQRTQETPAQ